MKKLWRILLADDHQLFRDALRTLLEKEPDLEVVAETGDGSEVVRLARESQTDIVCMDIGMPRLNGVEATRRLIAACTGIKVIAVSAFAEQSHVVNMLDAGAAAYVTKSGAGDELLRAIDAVRKGQMYLCPSIASVVAGALSNPREIRSAPSLQLTARERQVLQMIAEGSSSSQIAKQLNIARTTAEVHRRNLMRKLGLHSVAEVTRYAISHGIASG